MKQRTKRILLAGASLIAAIVIGVIVAAYMMLARSVPVTEGILAVPGVQGEIEITFDSLGIAQIWAETEHDGYFALGYQHAADRMFQMDLVRRVSQGRLSEALGEIGLEWDIHQRTIGHRRLARAAMGGLTEADRVRLQGYADGVNAYAATCRATPFEFHLLPIEFEKWTIFDCLTVFNYQTWYSNALQNSDEWYRDLAEKVGPERAAELSDPYPAWAPVTVPEEGQVALDSRSTSNDTGALRDVTDFTFRPPKLVRETAAGAFQRAVFQSLFTDGTCPLRMAIASNAWVVGPRKSLSGKAMLASDPHLEITRLPQLWYYVGLHIKQTGVNVLGITVPGMPFIVMGHNGVAAWAFTVAGIDVNDYYIEKINPDDDSEYLTSGGYRPFEVFSDTIVIDGHAEPHVTQIKVTERGPIVAETEDPGHVYSLRWAGFDADLAGAVTAGLDLAGVSDYGGFREIVTSLGALDANWMYADSAGNIGYQLGTPLAIRNRLEARLPSSGWTDEHEWQGYRLLDETPHVLNPERGWLASCNNLPTRGCDLVGKFAFARITRVEQLMHGYGKLSVQDMNDFQLDLSDVYRLRWRDTLAAALKEIGEDGPAMWTSEWRGKCDTNSAVSGLMLLFLDELQERFFTDELGTLAEQVRRATFEEQFWASADDSARHRLITESAAAAAALAAERPWGEMQTLSMHHPMASVPVLGDLLGLTRGPWAWGGSPGTLNATMSTRQEDGSFRAVVGPSWRFVIDFADVDAATIALPAGNSGNPMSDHFFDFFERYRAGERWQVPFHYDKVKARAVSTLVLAPEQ